MSSRLLAEWMAYYQLEPFGDELIDIHLSQLTALQVSTKKKPVALDKYRKWKKIADETGNFDPQEYYNSLKKAFRLEKKD